jgi:hypothetical protein
MECARRRPVRGMQPRSLKAGSRRIDRRIRTNRSTMRSWAEPTCTTQNPALGRLANLTGTAQRLAVVVSAGAPIGATSSPCSGACACVTSDTLPVVR